MEPDLIKFTNSMIPKISKLDGWCSIEKGQRLGLLVIEMNALVTVEVGIFGGRSLLPMALACKHKDCGKVHGIDPWKVDPTLEGINDPENNEWWKKLDFDYIKNRFIAAVDTLDVKDFCEWHQMKSLEALSLFEDDSIDVFHQDSNHSEEVSCSEVEAWMPKMKKKSAWVCDDAHWPSIQKSLKIIESYGYVMDGDYGNWRIYKRKK